MDDIVDRLNGRYSLGPHLPNGEPEFGWRQFQATPINQEAATIIERLRDALFHAHAALTVIALHEVAEGGRADLLESLIGTAKNELGYLHEQYGDLVTPIA